MKTFVRSLAFIVFLLALCQVGLAQLPAGTYQIQVGAYGDLCLKEESTDMAGKTDTTTAVCADDPAQLWTVTPSGDFYTLQAGNNGECLVANDAPIFEAGIYTVTLPVPCDGSENFMLWDITPVGGGYNIKSAPYGYCLDVYRYNREPGGAVYLHDTCNLAGAENQTWTLTPVSQGAGDAQSSTSGVAERTFPLTSGQTLERGSRFHSESGAYLLSLNTDGNLVVAGADGSYVWGFDSIGVDFSRVAYVVMQEDGNFAAYDSGGGYVWSVLTENPAPDSRLVLSAEGELQLVSESRGVVWSSGSVSAGSSSSSSTASGVTQDACSQDLGGEQIELNIVNESDATLSLVWVDHTCNEVPSGEIGPGQTAGYISYNGHAFRAYEAGTGNVLQTFVVDGRPFQEIAVSSSAFGSAPQAPTDATTFTAGRSMGLYLTQIDDSVQVLVNGAVVFEHGILRYNEDPIIFDLLSHLTAGANTVEVIATNGPGSAEFVGALVNMSDGGGAYKEWDFGPQHVGQTVFIHDTFIVNK